MGNWNRPTLGFRREAARQDALKYIELLCNPRCWRTNNGMLSPVDVEIRHQKLNEAGVQLTRITSPATEPMLTQRLG
jgi:hypothetical protein